jgi:hypothetical protein
MGRLSHFFGDSFPMQFNLRQPQTGVWLRGPTIAGAVAVLIGLCCFGLLALSARRGGRNLALAVGVVAFPLIQALLPAAWSWIDGRYTAPFVYLLVIAVAPGLNELKNLVDRPKATSVRLSWLPTAGLCSIIIAASLASLHSFSKLHSVVDPGSSYLSGWTTPDSEACQTVTSLERAGISDGFADYWVAYKLDFLSDGGLHLTDVPPDPDRWRSENRAVLSSREPDWIFVPPTSAAGHQFGNAEMVGPTGWDLESFEHTLDKLGISYRVVRSGLVVVVEPHTKITPSSLQSRSLAIRHVP